MATSYFSQVEGPPSPPHYSIGELVNWFSSELHSFFGTNHLRAPMVVSTQAGNSKSQEPAYANEPQSHPEGFTTFATAFIPSPGCAFPTRVILQLVPLPLHHGTNQYPSSLELLSPPLLDQGNEHNLFSSSQPSEQSPLSADYPMTGGDITKDTRYSEYAPTPGDFPIAPRDPIPQPEVRYDYQPSGLVDPTQEPIPDGVIAAASASPGVAVYPPPPFNASPRPYPVPSNPLPFSLANHSVVIPTVRTTSRNKKNRQSAARKIGQTYQDTPTLLTAAGPVRGVGVEHRHQCTKCNASYVWLSGLNRHFKDKHSPWMTCNGCSSEFSLGRMYKFTEHLQTCSGA